MVKKMFRVNKSLNRNDSVPRSCGAWQFEPFRKEKKEQLSHESHFRETKSKISPSSVFHPISWLRIILKS